MAASYRRLLKGFTVALTLGLLAGAGTVGYLGLNAAKTIFDLLGENKQLHAALTNLTQEQKIGYAKVLSQTTKDGKTTTQVLFVATDPEDQTKRLLEKTYSIDGDVVFFDALIVKFSPKLVMDGKERALYLWRRVYGENTPPSQGLPIETPGECPARYASLLDKLDLPDRQMFWEEIWKLADDPTRLAKAGVQAIDGHAVYRKVRPGLIYVFNLDANGAFYSESVPAL